MSRSPGVRRLVANLVALTILAAVSACGGSEPPAVPQAPLRILLVSDRGWNEAGVATLRAALRGAGHTVVQVSPARDGRAAGTAATTTGPISVRRPTPDLDIWSTNGTPADSALLGLKGLAGSPDLVISGIGDSNTTSLSAVHSGTVGAALTAASLRFPTIAVATDLGGPQRSTPRDFGPTADFVVRLIAAMRQQPPDFPLLPDWSVLNVNHPAPGKEPVGVVAAPTSNAPADVVSYRDGGAPGSLIAVSAPSEATGTDDDGTALAAGQVTLTDMSADPDRAAPPVRAAARLAPLMRP